jgi:quercetin dioxygenase-like cupin family protein
MAHQGQTVRNPVTGETTRFLQTAADTAGALLEFESSIPAGVAGPPPHIHPQQEERFIVLEGTLHAQMNGVWGTTPAGETLIIPAGTPHTFDMSKSDAVTFRVELRPALASEALFEALAGGSKNTLLQLAVTRSAHNIGFYLAGIPFAMQDALFALLAFIGKRLGYTAQPH